jgi:hypothetical protein
MALEIHENNAEVIRQVRNTLGVFSPLQQNEFNGIKNDLNSPIENEIKNSTVHNNKTYRSKKSGIGSNFNSLSISKKY